ncbi:alkylation response protein AidB-like acyl-CoA dehydrogenase [Desulfitobacterium sp. LBE]|uniref:Acyl-CoA dehydrogenase domain protein n=2 Tax=root TaxID=1 RepID=B8G0V8_DESHD|nr:MULTISPECIES: acyl-CoA dehydrogenase [Desulfitobacterium]ACL18377.1 acyl-CoA dehydrogenase domain protein [Desulfitobacterium hafniense DCB-2]MEA5023665.1 acyl-CoA dehydrogenase [Desulfitobacterium hafniense]TWH58695.1 alkylation response protein AidB-like acyl-CoA dehydrogenase [Desulfitobacterium sp. LBE]
MDFRMSEEQELLLESLCELIAREVTEADVKTWYENHAVSEKFNKAFIEAGFGFLGIPEEHGGTPADVTTLMLVSEEVVHQTCATIPLLSNILNMYDVVEFGTPEQIKLTMDITKETGSPAFLLAISEPQAGSDNMRMTTTAVHKDGKVILNGSKTWITHGGVAPYALVFAKEDNSDLTNKAISMYLVPSDTPGIKFAPLHKIGQTTTVFAEMYLDNVVCDESCLVGKKGEGFMQLMKNLEVERLLISSFSLGLAQAAMDDAAAYAGQRMQFGKTIGSFQLIQQKLTDMEIKIKNMRNMLYEAAWKADNGISIKLDSALAKRYICMTATEVCYEAMQIFGGLGYTTETRVSRAWQDARGWEFAGGTNEIMVHIAGREIVKKYAK